MKKKKKTSVLDNNKVFYALAIVISIIIIILFVNYFQNRSTIDPEGDLVKEIHSYFETGDTSNCEGFFNYSDKEINYENVSKEAKLCVAYQKANHKFDEYEYETLKVIKNEEICKKDDMTFRVEENTENCKVAKIPRDIIDKTYLKIFGKEITDNEVFYADNLNICYLKEGYYYCGLAETYTYILESPSVIYRAIKKSLLKEKGSEIEIYDYFLKATDDNCYLNYTTLDKDANCSKKIKKHDIKNLNYNFVKKYGTGYVHKYKKADDGTYYWISSKPINTN